MISFQTRVDEWMMSCFGPMTSKDKQERGWRFIEEALELVQACGISKEHVLEIVDYVYSRPVGEIYKEVGGVRVTLCALCTANLIKEQDAEKDELKRIWTIIDQVREKQAGKPLNNSPLSDGDF